MGHDNLDDNRPMPTPVPTKRTGLSRVLHAFTYSIDGLKTGWGEPAFRQEAILAIPLVPLAFVIGANWMETAMLIAVVALLLNTLFNALLIFGLGPLPALGVAGAGWATLLARTLEALLLMALFYRRFQGVGLHLAQLWQAVPGWLWQRFSALALPSSLVVVAFVDLVQVPLVSTTLETVM